MPSAPAALRKPRSLALELVDALGDRIRDGTLAAGDKLPTEAEIMGEFGVSRTVVREAISKLQASGLVQTRHGIGTFVVGLGDAAPFRVSPEQLATLRDVIALLELRIGIETEAAGLAALRRTEQNLIYMRSAVQAFERAIEQGRDAVGPDFQFHLEIARATQNPHFADIMASLGSSIIPRARLDAPADRSEERRQYLQGVNREHQSILDAIAAQDAESARAAMRTHLANSRERRRRAAGE
ncbi:FadR/GntR family transcriptional regulator [Methylibium rhizosphaerae]|jgi:GntR family transcriptional repressor for pyruvate dehydrogenase complex|uniref:FadR/GntR family transcriptional regulator n=1 Tax=Methylibium rhizosphaerae TaxID=2570323 RepID=UPI00112B8906|nr:FadR/GntR family transcriptional regulator [Methylibium rhizosphaerae]